MNITKAKYVQNYSTNISVNATIDGIDLAVPMDTGNRHYQAILKWVDAGNTIEAAS